MATRMASATFPGYLALDAEHVSQLGVERLLPSTRCRAVGSNLDELRAHLHVTLAARSLGPSHRTSEQIAHAQLAGDLCRRLGRAAVLQRRSARDHLHCGQPGELAADGIGHPVGEIRVR
jgi:hypothetical protein